MERTINKFIVIVVTGLVIADVLSHGAVSTALADTFFGGKGFFATTASLIAGK